MSSERPFSVWNETNGNWPHISVVILPKGNPGDILRQLDAFVVQDYPSWQYEVVLIDDGTFEDVDLVDVPVRVVRCQPCNKVAMLEMGMRAAKFPVILALDAGEVPARTTLMEFAKGFDDENTVLVMGRYQSRAKSGLSWCQQIERDRNCKWMIRRSAIDLTTRYPFAFRKEYFLEVLSRREARYDLLGRQLSVAALGDSRRLAFRYEATLDRRPSISPREFFWSTFIEGSWWGDLWLAYGEKLALPGEKPIKSAILIPSALVAAALWSLSWGFGVITFFLLLWLLSIADRRAKGLAYPSGPGYPLRVFYSSVKLTAEVFGFYKSICSDLLTSCVYRSAQADKRRV